MSIFRRLLHGGIIILMGFLLISCSDGDKPKEIHQHAPDNVICASLSTHGKYALVASFGDKAALWDVNKNKRLFSWTHSGTKQPHIQAVALSPTGKFALTAEDQTMVLWSLKTGKPLRALTFKSIIESMALSKNGKLALVALKNHTAELIELPTGKIRFTFIHKKFINSVALSHDGNLAITGSDDKTAQLWDTQSGKQQHIFKHKKPVNYVAISPNNQFILTDETQGDTLLWDTKSGGYLYNVNTFPVTLSAAKFSPSGQYLVLGATPRRLILWDLTQEKLIKQWQIPKPDYWKPSTVIIHALSFGPNEHSITSSDSNGYARVWEIK